jgi:predicted SAM-dependent methyltransferase
MYCELLSKVDMILKENNIQYWLDAGTLLCAYRDGDLSNEHDVDLGIFGEDYMKIWSLAPIFEQRTGCITEPFWPERFLHHFKLYADKKTHLLDMVSWYKLNNEIRACTGLRLPFVMPKYFFDSFTEVSFYKLSPYKFQAPERIEEYLEMYFGKDWKTPMSSEEYVKFQEDCVRDVSKRPEINKPYPNHKNLWIIWQAKNGFGGDISSVEAGIEKQKVKLHLGCGDVIINGWINVDLCNPAAQVKADAKDLNMFEDNSIDEIYSSHLIEHFHFHDGLKVLKEWKRVLKPGGKLVVELPDFLACCKKFIESSEEDRVNQYVSFWGYPWESGQTHLFGYTKSQMRWSLEQLGFTNLKELPALRYTGLENICQKWEAFKPVEESR